MQRLIAWYQKNFPLITTISAAVLLSIFIKRIPYINLFATYFATITLGFVLAICVTLLGNTLKSNTKILSALLLMSFLLEILTFSYQSELVGNLFYMLLFYVTIKEALSLRKK